MKLVYLLRFTWFWMCNGHNLFHTCSLTLPPLLSLPHCTSVPIGICNLLHFAFLIIVFLLTLVHMCNIKYYSHRKGKPWNELFIAEVTIPPFWFAVFNAAITAATIALHYRFEFIVNVNASCLAFAKSKL